MNVWALFILLTSASAHTDGIFSNTAHRQKNNVFREWNIRVVGNGYLRFLMPRSAEGADEESLYINYALSNNSTDPYAFSQYIILTPASCAGDNPPTMTPSQENPGLCVSTPDNCAIDGVNVNTTTCINGSATCSSKTGSSFSAANAATPVVTNVETQCESEHIVELSGATSLSPQIGDILRQDGVILGTISKMDGVTYTLYNTMEGTDFDDSTIDFVINGIVSSTSLTVVSQQILLRTYSTGTVAVYTPYQNRTFTPAVFGTGFTEVYSRFGMLHVNKFRMVVNANGLLLIGKTKLNNDGYVHVPEYYNSVLIKQNGNIEITYINGTNEYVGKINMVLFPNKYGLNIWEGVGFQIFCDGSGAFGYAMGTWCKNTELDGKTIWYYHGTVDSGDAEIIAPSAFSQFRIQQYRLNEDLYLNNVEPKNNY